MSSTNLQTFDLEALNSRSPTECQSTPCSGLYVPMSPLLLVLDVCNVNQSIGNHRLGSSDVARFDLEPLLQGQTRISKHEGLITHLLLVLEIYNVKTTSRKS